MGKCLSSLSLLTQRTCHVPHIIVTLRSWYYINQVAEKFVVWIWLNLANFLISAKIRNFRWLKGRRGQQKSKQQATKERPPQRRSVTKVIGRWIDTRVDGLNLFLDLIYKWTGGSDWIGPEHRIIHLTFSKANKGNVYKGGKYCTCSVIPPSLRTVQVSLSHDQRRFNFSLSTRKTAVSSRSLYNW